MCEFIPREIHQTHVYRLVVCSQLTDGLWLMCHYIRRTWIVMRLLWPWHLPWPSSVYQCDTPTVMNGLADVDRFKTGIQVCVWLGFPPMKLTKLILPFKTSKAIVTYDITCKTMSISKWCTLLHMCNKCPVVREPAIFMSELFGFCR